MSVTFSLFLNVFAFVLKSTKVLFKEFVVEIAVKLFSFLTDKLLFLWTKLSLGFVSWFGWKGLMIHKSLWKKEF